MPSKAGSRSLIIINISHNHTFVNFIYSLLLLHKRLDRARSINPIYNTTHFTQPHITGTSGVPRLGRIEKASAKEGIRKSEIEVVTLLDSLDVVITQANAQSLNVTLEVVNRPP